jgi:hypothetical protein
MQHEQPYERERKSLTEEEEGGIYDIYEAFKDADEDDNGDG